ncbi:TetR/AcrR family transcriptional regulator [Bosea sp. LjRoot237]|uniref:TetR/AcrR family transcriptional regulator n=1 Tax=Bosea sp. LjRoot237 TaxID=3342292 RepID=UPI003ECE5172
MSDLGGGSSGMPGTGGSRMRARNARRPALAGTVESVKQRTMRDEILDAAAEIIVREGYDACTMRAVAALVGMKAGSLYYHFRSKDEIVEEILNQGIETLYARVAEAVRDMPKETPFAQRLATAVGMHVASLVGKDQKYMHVYEHLPPAIRRRSRKMREKYAQLWYEVFAKGVASGEIDGGHDLRLLVPYFLGGLNRVPEWIRTSGAGSEQIAALATATLLDGIGARQ